MNRFLQKIGLWAASATVLMTALSACKAREEAGSALRDASPPTSQATRLENSSPWFSVDDADINYYADYAWVDDSGKRSEKPILEIQDKLVEMLRNAKTTIVASWFLFDCMQPEPPTSPVRDIVKEVTDILVEKSKDPNMHIAIMLDPINRAYSDRVSPAVQKLLDAGINVFYSDLSQTPPAVKASSNPINKVLLKLDQAQYQGVSSQDIKQDVVAKFEPLFEALQNTEIGAKVEGFTAAEVKALKQKLVQDQPLMIGNKKLAIDGVNFNLDLIYNILLLKANHRKLLVVDSGSDLEALVASANPHNPSIPSANSALSVKGPTAHYILNVLRQDFAHSIEKSNAQQSEAYKHRYAMWSSRSRTTGAQWLDTTIPTALSSFETPQTKSEKSPTARFVTENKIAKSVIEMLASARPDDEIRIQMFYLSEPKIVEAILSAATVVHKPIRLIMDPNKDAFNQIKDGTPNRQVAEYLRSEAKNRGGKLEIRWYDTHGEQNHAKVMSITSPNKAQIITGSGNWTGKNIGYNTDAQQPTVRAGSPNMESNMQIFGSRKVNDKFNKLFEMFWANGSSPDRIYTVKYDTDPYNHPVDDGAKWKKGEASGLVAW